MATPEVIGPYRVLRLLGQGGAGVVYEVADPMTGRSMALKLLLDADEDPRALEHFEREAQLLARVRHRSVVRVHKIGRLREGPYLLEELVQGELLRSASQRDPLEPRRAAAIVRELADALATVHAAGILHRDLKPSNVILQADGIPVVLDFGVARDTRAERMTRTGELIGSAAYMSPEQAKGKRSDELDARVDVYGLGAVLYELLSGQPPFSGSGLQMLRQVIKAEPPWPRSLRAEVPADLDGIVQVAMSKDPADRYANAEALRDDLDRFLAGTRAVRTPERPSSQGPLLAGVAAALGALGSIPTESKTFVRRAVSGMLSDAFVGSFLASLLHVRGGSLPWEREEHEGFRLRPRQSPLVVPSLLDPSSKRPATVSGRSAYREGRFREGSLTQSDERPEREAGRATWTLRLL